MDLLPGLRTAADKPEVHRPRDRSHLRLRQEGPEGEAPPAGAPLAVLYHLTGISSPARNPAARAPKIPAMATMRQMRALLPKDRIRASAFSE